MAMSNVPEQPAAPLAAVGPSPELVTGLNAVSHVARALVAGGTFEELASRAVAEVVEALDLAVAALYLPHPAGEPTLHRAVVASREEGRRAHDQLSFDPDAWHFAIAGGAPLVFGEPASWLVANPFVPAAPSWLVLPVSSEGSMLGVVIGGAASPISLDPVGATVLSSLGDLLGAGIATARLRQQVERTEVERERMRLAAELHDGLAQDLALAVRELALLESGPDPAAASASLERLRAAVTAAHRVVRAGLEDLSVAVPIGGIHAAVQELCDRFAERGVGVTVEHGGLATEVRPEAVAIVLRVLNEALANVERHAGSVAVQVDLRVAERALTLAVQDAGPGFDPAAVDGPGDGHFGLTIMRERARSVDGALEVRSRPGAGTLVSLEVPLS